MINVLTGHCFLEKIREMLAWVNLSHRNFLFSVFQIWHKEEAAESYYLSPPP
jgi:hypothetical protein